MPIFYVILIPAYNPTETLTLLLRTIRAHSSAPIVLVDDGSRTECRPVFDCAATTEKVFLVRHAVNLGKGAALKTGLNFGLVRFPEAKFFVTADADGQHLPEDIVKVAESSTAGSLTLGVRSFDREVPLKSKVGNTISRYVYHLVTGVPLLDTQTGLRSISRAFAEHCLPILANKYEFETAMIMTARKSSLAFKQVPIQTVYINSNRGTHFNPVLDSFRIYFLLVRYSVSSITAVASELVTFSMLSKLGMSIVAANLGGLALAMIVQFVILRRFVFKREPSPLLFAGYVAFAFASRYVSAVLQEEFVSGLAISPMSAKLIVDVVIFFINFLLLRDLVFHRWRNAE